MRHGTAAAARIVLAGGAGGTGSGGGVGPGLPGSQAAVVQASLQGSREVLLPGGPQPGDIGEMEISASAENFIQVEDVRGTSQAVTEQEEGFQMMENGRGWLREAI